MSAEEPPPLQRAAVLGAGVMGAGIAAHLANAGLQVDLLDVTAEGEDPAARARASIARLGKAQPAPLMHPGFARRLRPGHLGDLAPLAEADWVIEAVIEDGTVKRDLYARLAPVLRDDAVLSSNTSTLPRALLAEGMEPGLRQRFLITHFFNPPRYMRLLELVAGPENDAAAVARITDFADRHLGKGVVRAKDTPAFIANRIGTLWGQAALNAAFAHGLSVEEADALSGRPFGIPKTGTFGLIDLVGLDVLPLLAQSLLASLPEDDLYRRIHTDHPLLARMIAEGRTGRKAGAGFYRKGEDGGREAIDLATGTYRRREREVRLASLDAARQGGLAALIDHPDRGGRFARDLALHGLWYAAWLVDEIADGPEAVDAAMRLGYGWEAGPFALIDRIGVDRMIGLIEEAGWPVPPILEAARGSAVLGKVPPSRPPGVLRLADLASPQRIAGNRAASFFDIGEGVACLAFHSKMNAIEPATLEMIAAAPALIPEKGLRALVIGHDGENFSVGANLGIVLFAANIAAWSQVEDGIRHGQQAMLALRHAPFPVVGAPAGMALGGGCELLLHCDAVQAHAESYIGLVESGVGVVPGWGGCAALLARLAQAPGPGGPMPAVARAFETIALAKVSTSAFEARDLGYLRPEDGITMNRDRVLADARARAVDLAASYSPPEAPVLNLPGPAGEAALKLGLGDQVKLGRATAHDAIVAGHLAHVLAGGTTDPLDPMTPEAIHALEREAFMALLRREATLKRMEHMLETGKPLRN